MIATTFDIYVQKADKKTICLVSGLGLRSEVIGGVRFVENRPHDENIIVSTSHNFSLKLSYHPPLVLFPRFGIHFSTAATLSWRLLRLVEECCCLLEWCCYCFLPWCHFFFLLFTQFLKQRNLSRRFGLVELENDL